MGKLLVYFLTHLSGNSAFSGKVLVIYVQVKRWAKAGREQKALGHSIILDVNYHIIHEKGCALLPFVCRSISKYPHFSADKSLESRISFDFEARVV